MVFPKATALGLGKHSHLMIRLFAVGGAFLILSWVSEQLPRDWLAGVGLMVVAAGVAVFVSDSLAETKESQSKSGK